MSNQRNAKYIYGSAARDCSSAETSSNIIEFPGMKTSHSHSLGQHGRKQTISNRVRVELGDYHYRNLMGAPSQLTKTQLALSGSVFTLCGVLIVLVSSIL